MLFNDFNSFLFVQRVTRGAQVSQRVGDKLSLQNCVSYKNIILDNQNVREFVLPAFRDTAFKLLHANLSHYGRDRTLHLMRERFDWPGFQLEN